MQPEKCLWSFAVPLCKEDFLNDLKEEVNKDYAKSRYRKFKYQPEALYKIDHEPLVQLIEQALDELKDYKIGVVRNFGSNSFDQLLNYDVFTLFSHADKDSGTIDLSDGLVSVKDFADMIPVNYKGIFDLSSCYSLALQTEIKKRFSNIVIGNEKATTAEFRILLYKNTIKLMKLENCKFIDALIKIRIHLIKLYGKH